MWRQHRSVVKTRGPPDSRNEYLQRKRALPLAWIIRKFMKFMRVHFTEWSLCGILRESLKNFIRPFHLQFLLLLPRAIKAMVTLMRASQHPQASIILGWHPGSICFLPGLHTFLLAPTKHFGKVFCKTCRKYCWALVCLCQFEFLFPSIPHCDRFRKVALSSLAHFLKRLCRWWPHFFDTVWMISLYQQATVALLLRNMLRDWFRKHQ